MSQELACDRWGTLTVTTRFEDGDSRTRVLGHVEGAWERIPPGMGKQYRRLLDDYRDGFDPRAEQVAAFKIAKGI